VLFITCYTESNFRVRFVFIALHNFALFFRHRFFSLVADRILRSSSPPVLRRVLYQLPPPGPTRRLRLSASTALIQIHRLHRPPALCRCCSIGLKAPARSGLLVAASQRSTSGPPPPSPRAAGPLLLLPLDRRRRSANPLLTTPPLLRVDSSLIKIEVDRLDLFLSQLDSIGSARSIYYGSSGLLGSVRRSGSALLLCCWARLGLIGPIYSD
jgi:hypothetical protein